MVKTRVFDKECNLENDLLDILKIGWDVISPQFPLHSCADSNKLRDERRLLMDKLHSCYNGLYEIIEKHFDQKEIEESKLAALRTVGYKGDK